MTLTPQQHLEAYEWAKECIKEEVGSNYVCIQLCCWLMNEFNIDTEHSSDSLPYFPEFLAQKPVDVKFINYRWFLSGKEGRIQRLAALDRAIELVKAQL